MVRPISVASLCAPFTPELCEESQQSWSERGFSCLDTDLQNAYDLGKRLVEKAKG